MVISLIVAAAENNAIGKDNQLLWCLPGDMKFFKNTTWALPVVMGRKTYEALGKPLPGRLNIVITSQEGWQKEGVLTAASLPEAIAKADEAKTNEIFVIGGGQVYTQAIPIANKMYITRVHASLEGDAYFPEFDKTEWNLVSSKEVAKDYKNEYDHSFELWERK